MSQNTKSYYLPSPSFWPLISSITLFLMAGGFIMMINKIAMGKPILIAGFISLAYLLYGWFSEVIGESVDKLYNKQVDKSLGYGMVHILRSDVLLWFLWRFVLCA
jgi:cytochrome c oxidase subunit III